MSRLATIGCPPKDARCATFKARSDRRIYMWSSTQCRKGCCWFEHQHTPLLLNPSNYPRQKCVASTAREQKHGLCDLRLTLFPSASYMKARWWLDLLRGNNEIIESDFLWTFMIDHSEYDQPEPLQDFRFWLALSCDLGMSPVSRVLSRNTVATKATQNCSWAWTLRCPWLTKLRSSCHYLSTEHHLLGWSWIRSTWWRCDVLCTSPPSLTPTKWSTNGHVSCSRRHVDRCSFSRYKMDLRELSKNYCLSNFRGLSVELVVGSARVICGCTFAVPNRVLDRANWDQSYSHRVSMMVCVVIT